MATRITISTMGTNAMNRYATISRLRSRQINRRMLRRMRCRAKSSPDTYSASITSNLRPEPGARYASATSRASRTKNATPHRPRICARFFNRSDTFQDISGTGVDASASALRVSERALLFLPQSRHRIDPARAAGRHKTGDPRGDYQHRNRDDESRCLSGLHSFHQSPQYPACCHSRSCAQGGAKENHSQALPQYQPHDLAGAGSKRHSHADFRHALASQVRQNTIDADARQQQSQAGENAEQE